VSSIANGIPASNCIFWRGLLLLLVSSSVMCYYIAKKKPIFDPIWPLTDNDKRKTWIILFLVRKSSISSIIKTELMISNYFFFIFVEPSFDRSPRSCLTILLLNLLGLGRFQHDYFQQHGFCHIACPLSSPGGIGCHSDTGFDSHCNRSHACFETFFHYRRKHETCR
jgi:hypothetical protein